MEEIRVQGARIHNLKHISLSIPKNKLVAITGISGSGKSSLVFNILFEEGKNQYLRSIGILSGLDNEDRFDTLQGIGPTVAVRRIRYVKIILALRSVPRQEFSISWHYCLPVMERNVTDVQLIFRQVISFTQQQKECASAVRAKATIMRFY